MQSPLTPLLLSAFSSQPARGQAAPDMGLLLFLALLQSGGKPQPPKNPDRSRMRSLTLRRFCAEHYLPERKHAPNGPTAELADAMIDQLESAVGHEPTVGELSVGVFRQFRTWWSAKIAKGLSPATANLHFRQLRAIWNHAAKWRWTNGGRRWRAIKPPAPIDFFAEPEPDVNAWTLQELATIEARARTLTGKVGDVPAEAFWAAWALVFARIGSRVTATMLTERGDYDAEAKALLLRREHQKQKADQRIALTPNAAAAVERLLSLHRHDRIFGSWPFDPPDKKTGRRHWKVLSKHFMKLLVTPSGLSLPKGVKTRQFRRTAATIVDERGGNAQQLLGHQSPKTTARYKDRKRQPICRQSLLIPDVEP